MRSVDVFKCWPFSTSPNVTAKDLHSWLPPMTPSSSSTSTSSSCSTSSSSSSSFQSLRSTSTNNHQQQSLQSDQQSPPPASATLADEERLEMVCPVCREFNAATLTAVNAHIDACLAQTVRDDRRHIRITTATSTATTTSFKSSSSSHAKPKAPKKRSIAEIFKVNEQGKEQQLEQENDKERELEKEQDKEKEKDEGDEEEEPRIESVLKLWKKDGVEHEDSVVDDVSITVTKFQWLSQRLEALRSGRRGGQSAKSDAGGASGTPAEAIDDDEEEKSEMVCPVCRDFNAATVTAVNAHIDNCLAQAVRDERRQMRRSAGVSGGGFKHKPKAPKKRSIAEILTVAPPIGATKSKAIEVAKDYDEEDNGDEDNDKSSDYSGLNSAGAAAADADCDGIVVSTTKNKKSTTTKSRKKKKKKKTKEAKKKSKVVENLNSEKTITVNKQQQKKKKKKKSFFNSEVTTSSKKEDACKRKVQTPVNSFRQLKATIGTKMLAHHNVDPSIHERKLDSKISFVEKEQKVKTYEPDAKQPKSVYPFCGILKNRVKQLSGKASSSSSTQDGTDEYSCDDEYPTSDRYVRFTCKDDILGPKRRNSFEETMFNKSSDVLTTSLVKEQSSGSDRETSSLGANRSYDYAAINIDNRKEFCPIVESKEFANTLEQATAQNFLKPCPSQKTSTHSEEKSQTLTKVMLCDDNNLHPFDGGNTSTLHCSPYDDIPSPLSTDQEVKMSGTNSQLCESGSLSSIGKFIDHLEDSTFRAVPVNSDANTRTFLEPSSSYSSSYDKGNERPEFPLQTYEDNDDSSQAFGDRQFSHMLASDMIDNAFLYTAWGKGSIRNNCLDPSFFGLPLNSHGELVNFSSSGTVGTNQPETSSTLRGSLSGLPVNSTLHQDNQENLRINERQVVQKISPTDGLNSFPHYPARLAVTELPCDRDVNPTDSDMCSSSFVQPPNSEVNVMRNLPIEQNQYGQVQSHKGDGMVSVKESSDHVTLSSSQPTMRLMGKDVPIGGSSKAMQQLSGDVWAGEESGRRQSSEYGASENSLLGKCSKQDLAFGRSSSIDNVVQSPKIQSSQGFRCTVLMNGHDTEFPPQFADLQRNHVSQNGSHPVSRNGSSYFHPITHEPASCAMFNGAPDDFPERFMPGAKPQGLSSQSQVQATPCNFSPPTYLNNGELHDRNKNPHHVAKSAFEFPFLQTSNNEQAKSTSWSQRPYRSLPSWLSGPTDERLPVTFSHQFSGVSNPSFSQCIWGNKFTTSSASLNHSAQVLYPSNPLTYPSPMKTNHLSPVSIAQPPHVPITSSPLNTGCRTMNMVSDSVKLDHNIAKNYHACTNTRKRPAPSALDDSRKPIKLPNIEVQENSSRMTNSGAELQRHTRVTKLDPRLDGARGRCCQNEAQKLSTTSYPAVDSFKLDGTVTGPVRLGPRAKHILRSS
ncbi:uncharacterized protein LOC107608884 isoform X2 [Arachis ipaensis]|nr:uncharacterized protein LOC107608884 isoform X2 [Arachis ipaensis]RYR00461.1 hypothetical protein Ahy_B07g088582 isoform B [Arachis hypogaea]